MKNAHIPYNKKKIKVKYITGYSYEKPSYRKDSLLSFLRASFAITSLSLVFYGYGLFNNSPETQFLSPIAKPPVFGGDIKVQAATESATPTFDNDIEAYIYEVFKEDGEDMVKLFTCESGLNPETIGDEHLMGWLDGEYLGDSVGIAQIRTGDAGIYDSKPWNRAKANGMTVIEFRAKLKDPIYNVDYSKTIFDRQGITAWYHCAIKTGLIKE